MNIIGDIVDRSWIPLAYVTATQAEQWRLQFHSHLLVTDKGLEHPNLITGGMVKTDSLTASLEQLLQEHGVPPSEISQRALDVVNQLGRHAVGICLRSARPWKDLKARANAHTPLVQLVMPGELNERIKQKAVSGQPIQSKRKQNKKNDKPPAIQLRPDDIVIPDGVFQTQAEPIVQIQIPNIGPDAQGVIIARMQDAIPYMQMNQPVSSNGLALLIIDHQHESLANTGVMIRFPAKCTGTGEPMIVTAKLVQLCKSMVERSQPAQKMAIEETETLVIRVTAFKDELDANWNSFCAKPVRYILQELGLSPSTWEGESPIVDVWDRQWLSLRMDKSQADSAAMYAVNLRLTGVPLHAIVGEIGAGRLVRRTKRRNWETGTC